MWRRVNSKARNILKPVDLQRQRQHRLPRRRDGRERAQVGLTLTYSTGMYLTWLRCAGMIMRHTSFEEMRIRIYLNSSDKKTRIGGHGGGLGVERSRGVGLRVEGGGLCAKVERLSVKISVCGKLRVAESGPWRSEQEQK